MTGFVSYRNYKHSWGRNGDKLTQSPPFPPTKLIAWIAELIFTSAGRHSSVFSQV